MIATWEHAQVKPIFASDRAEGNELRSRVTIITSTVIWYTARWEKDQIISIAVDIVMPKRKSKNHERVVIEPV
jgi:hypothetical protein